MHEFPEEERRVLHHLLSHPEHAYLILDRLGVEHFTDAHSQYLFQLLAWWRSAQGYALTLDSAMEEVNQRVKDDAVRGVVTSLLMGLVDFTGSTKNDLEHSVNSLDNAYRSQRVLTITQSLTQKLATAADSDIRSELADLWNVTNPDFEGTNRHARDTRDFYMRKYRESKTANEPPGMSTGFSRIDGLTGGMRRRQFWVMSAFTSQGKTATAQNVFYHFGATGRRALYCSLEMDEDDLFMGLHARHSHEITKRVRGTTPLKIEDIRDGRLSSLDEKLYELAVKEVAEMDLTVWCPDDVTLTGIRQRVSAEQLVQPLDLVIIDYVTLCQSEDRYRRGFEEVGHLMKECKRLARRERVPVLGLHQISRDGFEKAAARGHYNLNDLAGSAEVERNADVVWWSMLTEDLRAQSELRYGIMKNRRGDLLSDGYHVFTDFASGMVAERLETKNKTDFFSALDTFVK